MTTATTTKRPVGRPHNVARDIEIAALPGDIDGDIAALEVEYQAALAATKATEAAANAPPRIPTTNAPCVLYRQVGAKVEGIEATILKLHPPAPKAHPADPAGPARADVVFYIDGQPHVETMCPHDPGFAGAFGLVGEPPRRPPTALETLEQEIARGNSDAPVVGKMVYLLRPNRLGTYLKPIDAEVIEARSMSDIDIKIRGDLHLNSDGHGTVIKGVQKGKSADCWVPVGWTSGAGIPIGEPKGPMCANCGEPMKDRGKAIVVNPPDVPLFLMQVAEPTALVCWPCTRKLLYQLNAAPNPVEPTAE